jgi:DNA-binding GntR family transcriptional regulator
MSEFNLKKRTISAQVADAIRTRILSGQYAAGAQLRQEHLAAEIGVSRIPVREALHQLRSEGFVTLVSHKGAIVSIISPEEILELYELRAQIEKWLLSLAIPFIKDADLETAAEGARQFGKLAEHSELSHALNWQFHSSLYKPSRRNLSIDSVFKIHQQLERYTRMMVNFAGSQTKSDKEHFQLLELCKQKDTLRAINLLDMHIMDGGRFLYEHLIELRNSGQANQWSAP